MNHPVVITFLILAIIAFLYAASQVFKPLALAVLLSFALTPISRFLENRGLPRVPAVILTVLIALGGIGFMAYNVGYELNILAGNVDRYEKNILDKINRLQPSQAGAFQKVQAAVTDVSKTLSGPPKEDVQRVQLAKEPDFFADTESQLSPYLEGMETGFIVLILLLFLMINRENMSDRIVQLFGQGRISLTTRTTTEVGERISKYLTIFASMNTAMGIIVGLSCYAIGIEYAVLWGFLAGALRFIPYAGPATAFALPLLFSIAAYDGWTKPLSLIGLYAFLEVGANMALEPIIYGKTTGVSALALLVAAMFWTWLWGPIGLLLSTPLTVSLAVLGKYVPNLRFFATFLHEDIEMDPSVRFYQRLLAGDQDGATDIIDEILKECPRADVFDQVVIPTLSLAERDHARDEIDETEIAFIHRVTNHVLDDLEDEPEVNLTTLATDAQTQGVNATPDQPSAAPLKILALPAHDDTDALVLNLLGLLLKPAGITMWMGQSGSSPLKAVERIIAEEPDVVLISHLPPDGLTATRYLTRRIRARFPPLDDRGGSVGSRQRERGCHHQPHHRRSDHGLQQSGRRASLLNPAAQDGSRTGGPGAGARQGLSRLFAGRLAGSRRPADFVAIPPSFPTSFLDESFRGLRQLG